MSKSNIEQIFAELINHPSNANFTKQGWKPLFSCSDHSKIAIISQAPSLRSQESGISWLDPSGDNLRKWLNVQKSVFYDPNKFAFIPMDFYFPGKGSSGDAHPRIDFATNWHFKLWEIMQKIELKILIGQHSQKYYLSDRKQPNLTQTIQNYTEYLPEFLVLPHPSPKNRFWLAKNPWFNAEVLPVLKQRVSKILSQD